MRTVRYFVWLINFHRKDPEASYFLLSNMATLIIIEKVLSIVVERKFLFNKCVENSSCIFH